jgi:O-antigen ligase
MIEAAANCVLFFLPFGYFLWRRGGSKVGISNALLGYYVYPLTLLTMLSGEGFALSNFSISLKTANLLRAGTHVLFACWLIRMALKSRARFRVVPGIIPALVAVALMFLSAFFLGTGLDALLRIALLLILVFNIFILIPTVVGDEQKSYYRELTQGSVFLALYLAGLSTIVIGLHGNFPDWSLRLGRPLNPGVLAVLLVFAFIPALFVNRNLIVIGGLFVALIATGSRFPLAFAVVWLIVEGIKRATVGRRVGLALLACLSIGYVYWVQSGEISSNEQGIFERSDIWSGRMLLWIDVLDSIKTSPLWGQGDRAYLENIYTEEQDYIRPHNMLLENSMSYGIPAALAAFAVYLVMGFSAYRAWKHRQLHPGVLDLAPMWLYFSAVQLGATMVETTSWLNLGDGGSVLLFLFVGPGLANAKAALATQKNTHGPQIRMLGSHGRGAKENFPSAKAL